MVDVAPLPEPRAGLDTVTLDLVAEVLGEAGLAGVPEVRHETLVAAAVNLVLRLTGVEECWYHEPGPLADVVADHDRATGRPWVTTLTAAARHDLTGRVGHGSVAALPVHRIGEPAALAIWRRAVGPWTPRELGTLRAVADALGRALDATASHQLTPDQRARAEFDRLRAELLETLNHELRTPLTVLGMSQELLREDLEDRGIDGVDGLLERAERSLERLDAIVHSIARLGAGATGDQRLATSSGPGVDAVALALEVAETWGGQRRVDVVVTGGGPETPQAPAGLPLVAVPADDLREVLDRLLSNAVKFSADGTSVEVHLHAPDPPRRRALTLEVRDHGVGVPATELHRVGAPFFRASNARARQVQGPGLGLAAATTLARGWGGDLTLRSEDRGGTTAVVLLPTCQERACLGAVGLPPGWEPADG